MEDPEEYDHALAESPEKNPGKKGFWRLLTSPVDWLKMLCEELHWSFVLGVVIVYGISQGLGVGLSRISTQYYMKDEQKMQPSEAQVYFGMIQIPWVVKPLWGLFTDTVPILGYRRRPYFLSAAYITGLVMADILFRVYRIMMNRIPKLEVFDLLNQDVIPSCFPFFTYPPCVLIGFIGISSMLVLSLHKKLHLAFAMLSLIAGSAGIAIADVTIDACVTQNSISHPSLAGDMQSLCGLSSSIGALIGFSLSGFFVHLVGPKGVFGLLSIPFGLVVLVGMLLRESRVHNSGYMRVSEKLLDAGKTMLTTLKFREVWRPCLYMYLSLALALNIHEGMFYWYTESKGGPSFSQEIVGSISAIGAVGSLFGVLIYQNLLRNKPFRGILFWIQLLYGASGLLDLVLVLRINLKIGLPDYFFAVIDAAISLMIGRIKWMPLLVLSSKLCPSGIEGTFFALLMSIDHVGMLSSSSAGGLLLHILKVTRTQFDNLWVAILIRSLLRIVPIGFLFLIPKSDPNSSILSTEMMRTKKGTGVFEPETIEMVSLVNTT